MELFRALAVLAEPPTEKTAHLVESLGLGDTPGADEYTELFVFQLYPYASVYLGREGMMGGEARDRVAGFWRALGQTPPAEPDHLSVMLALYARLAELEEAESDAARRAGWRNARRAFLWEHLLSWLPVYLSKLAEIAPPVFKSWGEMLMRALTEESEIVGGQEALPVHLRVAPGLVDPRSGRAEDFLQSLLAPVRFGGILARADLVRGARRLDLSLRMGERRFILKSLFAQDARAVLVWLEEEAISWSERHRSNQKSLGSSSRAWGEKAEAAATLLRELRLTTPEVI
ncbi:MAG TPA: molecular chaperone TorD family protein [Pyrinomonadaceae bacterium]